jgi:Sulfotransferase domain
MNPAFITVVSGLPRSGTSLMMQMLAAGGCPILSDNVRAPDESNPRGYLELEAVKRLRTDQSWLSQAQGKAVKIIHLLLRELPVDDRFAYRVVFMNRPIDEVLSSQRTMLERQGKKSADGNTLKKTYESQLVQARQWLATQPSFGVHFVDYHALLKEPLQKAKEVSEFLSGLDLDAVEMSKAVDQALYRERNAD